MSFIKESELKEYIHGIFVKIVVSFLLPFNLCHLFIYFQEKIRSAIQILIGGNIVGFGMLAYTGDDGLYRNVIMPIFRLLDAETAHKFAVKAAKYGFIPRMKNFDSPVLVCV